MKRFPNPLYITKFRSTNDFLLHVVCYEERDCQLLKFSMSRGKKRAVCSFVYFESSQGNFLTYFQKPKCFLLFITKDNLMGKFESKLFSDANRTGPLLQRSPQNLYKLFSLPIRWLVRSTLEQNLFKVGAWLKRGVEIFTL